MADLKIKIFKSGATDPETTVTIPSGVLKMASKFIPKQAAAALQRRGINLDELVQLSQRPDTQGTLIEVEEPKKGERIVITIE